jgi:hypothetical protein
MIASKRQEFNANLQTPLFLSAIDRIDDGPLPHAARRHHQTQRMTRRGGVNETDIRF